MKRTDWLRVRLSPVEKAEIEARAEEDGLELSEHVRQRSRAKHGVAGLQERINAAAAKPLQPPDEDFEGRVTEKIRTLRGVPDRNKRALALREVRREMAKEAAR